MSKLKTTSSQASPIRLIEGLNNVSMKQDCFKLLKIMEDITAHKAVVWSNSMIGFGRYQYKTKSGHEGEWFMTGFAPRSKNLSIYLLAGLEGEPLLDVLGKHKIGKSCLYIQKLDDIDIEVLKQLISKSVKFIESQGSERATPK